MSRIGFCCKWLDPQTGAKTDLSTRATTVAWLKRQSVADAEQRMWDITVDNLKVTKQLIEKVGTFDDSRRMVRIGSDLLPMYTHNDYKYYWSRPDVLEYCAKHFKEIGEVARKLDVRLSFHPGQFCVLASDNDGIVERSIEEFEYHVDMARWMGYGNSWHDHGFKINVHLSGRGGPDKFLKTLGRLSPEARNLITIENDEITNGLDVSLAVAEHVAIVLDIHHHWINSGEYIDPMDSKTLRVLDSWRGVRPTIHYSVSREDVLVDHCRDSRPELASLLARGFKKQKLRAHSDMMWNNACNNWALGFAENFDIQVEAKAKNLASDQLYQRFIK